MTKPIPPAERSAIGYTDRGFYIPERIAKAIDGYLQRGEVPGHFLQAVIRNDLAAAVGRADDENLANLSAIVTYFYNAAPSPSWGSPEKMTEWIARFPRPGVPA